MKAGLVIVAGLTVLAPCAARGQSGGPGPPDADAEAVAQAFFHGLGRLQWNRIVDLLDPVTLESFDRVAGQIVESLRGDSVLAQLYGTTLEGFRSWSDRETFLRTTSAMVDYARGLMESQVTTDVEILGSVTEGDSLAHVVYRERTDHMGTVVEDVAVTTLRRMDGLWRILRNDELDVLESALRGLPIGRTPPPGMSAARPGECESHEGRAPAAWEEWLVKGDQRPTDARGPCTWEEDTSGRMARGGDRAGYHDGPGARAGGPLFPTARAALSWNAQRVS